jgi:hypothetical protein
LKGNEEVIEQAQRMPVIQALSDRDLLLEIGKGDLSAFDELQRRYYAGLRAFVHRHVHTGTRVDFIVQEVFLHVRRKSTLFNARSQSTVHLWLYAIADRFLPRVDADAGVELQTTVETHPAWRTA